MAQTSRRLQSIGESLESIGAIVISHEHSDHIQGLPSLLSGINVPIYIAEKTLDAIRFSVSHNKIECIRAGENFTIGDLKVSPFSVPHDAVDPLAFVFEAGGLKLGHVTDLGYVTGLVTQRLKGCDAIVEVTETGSTLRANNLRIVEELLQTNTQLIANRDSYQDPWKREKIEQISLLLQGALRAEGMVGLKMNVSANDLKSVIEILPSITAPTISNLFQTDWFSVETIISEKIVRELIPKLQRRGAVGIIEYPLNKVI